MLKRKPSHEPDASPHVLSSIFGHDPTRRQRKRLFRSKSHNKHVHQPEQETAMTELLDFVLQHEEAFKK
jgi:charged multivesicular body protein 7